MEKASDELAMFTGRDDALAVNSNATWPTDDVTGQVTVCLRPIPRIVADLEGKRKEYQEYRRLEERCM